MSTDLPTLRQNLFRIHFVIALVAISLLFIVISLADWSATRRLLVAAFEESFNAAAQGTATYLGWGDLKGMELHLRDFHGMAGLQVLCVYNSEDRLISDWRADEEHECPQRILSSGRQEDWLNISTAHALMKGKTYIGMLYAQGRVVIWPELLMRNSIIMLALFAAAYGACRYSSRFGARAVAVSLQALQGQIEDLMEKDEAGSSLLPPMTTRETADLARTVLALREHLIRTTLPRGQLAQLRAHYNTLLNSLLDVLRQRLNAESPLLAHLANYELLLQLEQEGKLPEPRPFDISVLLKTSVAAARAEWVERPNVHLNASVQSFIPQLWLGQPEMISMLIKHLLLVGLHRTQSGAVCLRLELDHVAPSLCIKLEDSGPPLQIWQLRQWLAPQRYDDLTIMDKTQDISWSLSGRLFHYLGGRAEADIGPNGGIVLVGMVPVSVAAMPEKHESSLPSAPPIHAASKVQPLVILVEPNPMTRAELVRLFALNHCRCFTLTSHAEAMEWAPALPGAAIMFNTLLPDMGVVVARRLRHLAEEGIMQPTLLWATVSSGANDREAWENAGISQFVHLPLQAEHIAALCRGLTPPPPDYYHAYDTALHAELPDKVRARLSELNREVAHQIDALEVMLDAMARNEQPHTIGEQAHAVKSAALSLGYFRLAALMAQIEHAVTAHYFQHSPEHWAILAAELRATRFEHL